MIKDNLSKEMAALSARLGPTLFRQRIHIQSFYASHIFGQGLVRFHIENARGLNKFLSIMMKLCGLHGWGYRNYLGIEARSNDVFIWGLPSDFDGYTILHLSDLHIDLDDEFAHALAQRIRDLDYDLCVITGDFRSETTGSNSAAVAGVSTILEVIKTPVYAVLGNHDFIEVVPELERLGIRFLLNENTPVAVRDSHIYLAGIDDPHMYETDNCEKSRDGIPDDMVSILLAHSPEVFRQAAASGFDFMMCGHTHGGQVCLPGGVALLRNGKCPRYMIRGPWSYHGLSGYTSAGAGASGVPLRYWCPPEVTLHTLHPSEEAL